MLPQAEKEQINTKDWGSPSSPPPLRLTAMPQFVIEKQGRFDNGVWHTRVLTVDPTQSLLYLSKAHKAEHLDHRCMSRIDLVELWPTYDAECIREAFDSELAVRTLCVRGLVGIKTQSLLTKVLNSIKIQKKEGETLPAQAAETPSAQATETASPLSEPGGIDSNRSLETVDPSALCAPCNYPFYEEEVWVIRTMTGGDLRDMADSLRATLPEASVKGHERLMQRLVYMD
ncbi:hypothetical protein, conserved [Leishmania lindenbergi]|uniref:Uncharacterized protein n=1 Tax=Leishmania lindenbergi TaxID=651832 RepID=A0AAW3A660_9TRYP